MAWYFARYCLSSDMACMCVCRGLNYLFRCVLWRSTVPVYAYCIVHALFHSIGFCTQILRIVLMECCTTSCWGTVIGLFKIGVASKRQYWTDLTRSLLMWVNEELYGWHSRDLCLSWNLFSFTLMIRRVESSRRLSLKSLDTNVFLSPTVRLFLFWFNFPKAQFSRQTKNKHSQHMIKTLQQTFIVLAWHCFGLAM